MNSPSLLDLLRSFFHPSQGTSLLQMLPSILFDLAAMWLSFAGWRRHRASGFLLLLAGWSVDLIATLIFMYWNMHYSPVGPNMVSLLGFGRALNIICCIFIIAGLVCLVYYTRILPAEPGQEG